LQLQHFKLTCFTQYRNEILRSGEKYCIRFVDNLFLFSTVKQFSKSVNNWRLQKFGTTWLVWNSVCRGLCSSSMSWFMFF